MITRFALCVMSCVFCLPVIPLEVLIPLIGGGRGRGSSLPFFNFFAIKLSHFKKVLLWSLFPHYSNILILVNIKLTSSIRLTCHFSIRLSIRNYSHQNCFTRLFSLSNWRRSAILHYHPPPNKHCYKYNKIH